MAQLAWMSYHVVTLAGPEPAAYRNGKETRMVHIRGSIAAAVLALSAAGSVLAGSAVATAAPVAATATASHIHPSYVYDG